MYREKKKKKRENIAFWLIEFCEPLFLYSVCFFNFGIAVESTGCFSKAFFAHKRNQHVLSKLIGHATGVFMRALPDLVLVPVSSNYLLVIIARFVLDYF